MTMSEPNILIADDEPDTLKYLGMNLKARDYKVITASDGTEALKAFRERSVNLVMLDVMMPGPDGFQVCKKIREESDVPIIMLTAKATEADIVKAFECGADDYLTKPFGVGELLARVGGALRRGPAVNGLNGKPISFKNVIVDLPARRVWKDGKPVELTPIELSILSLLIRNKDRVLTHRYILEAVWGNEYSGEKEYVRAYIYRLRRKLERNPEKPDHIVNISGVGYMFVTEEPPIGS